MRFFVFMLFLIFVFIGCDDSSNNKQNPLTDSDIESIVDENEPYTDEDTDLINDESIPVDEDICLDEDENSDVDPDTDIESDMDDAVDTDENDDDSDVCVNASERTASCGLNDNGTITQICNNGEWEDSGTCNDPDECINDLTRSVVCGYNNNGSLNQICTNGAWVDSGTCNDTDVCVNGSISSDQCGLNNTGVKVKNCVNGQWVYEECWTAHGMLLWSDVSPNTLTWDNAVTYCSNKGARIPTISELRTIVTDCNNTATSGVCTVIDSCLISSCVNSECIGCAEQSDGRYSYFGDTNYLWSASEYNDSYVWRIEFKTAAVSYSAKGNMYNSVRCVK